MRVAVPLLATLAMAAVAPRVAVAQEMTATATGSVIVRLKRGVNSADVQDLIQRLGARISRSHNGMNAVLINLPTGVTSSGMAMSLQASGIVEYAEPEVKMWAFAAPNDPSYSQQWGLQDSGYGIKAQSAWNTTAGEGITVAVVDTGVRTDCPDLAGTKILAGFNALNNSANSSDDNGHGTHVSGTIAQTTNNSYGCAGVAHKSAILPVKVLGADGSGSNFSVAAGIRWAADHGARVINLSLGGSGGTTLLEAVRYAVQKGAVVCAAAGNSGTGSISYPAAYSETISVGAIASTGKRASFSQYGTGLSVVAPGVNILQQTWSPQQGKFIFGSWAGTSMATPHVAGAAALVMAKNPSLTPAQVKDILQRTARDLGTAGWDAETGNGLIDAVAALNAAGGSPTPPPSPAPSPSPAPAPSPGTPTHDVAVTQIQAPASVAVNTDVAIGVQVQNQGSVTEDVRVTLTDGPASDGTSVTVRVAPGELGTANFTWPSGSSAASRQLTAQAQIVGQTDSDASDNSRVATINVGNTATALRFRVYTLSSTYRVGESVAIRHIVESSTGVRISGASIRGSLTGANGRSLAFSGTTNSEGSYVATVRLAGGGGYGAYSVQSQASASGGRVATASWRFNVVE